MVKICKECKDPCWCESLTGKCEIQASENSEENKETYLDDKKYKEDELKQEFKDNFEED